MTGFMNVELEAIRDNMKCGHCGTKFKGSNSQARKVKYENRVVYCSSTCRCSAHSQKARARAVMEGKTPRKGVLAGPCKKCGKFFESRIDKQYCSIDCYVSSDQFREMQSKYWTISDEVKAKISSKLRKGEDVPCLECGTEFYQKPPSKGRPARKFCSTTCYRTYLSKRFDRWIANPEGMALPQCYDEFLDRHELSCVMEGCDWKGKHLTLHINQAHGVISDEFKRAAGFNLSTGVISKPLAEALRKRECVGVAAGSSEADLAVSLTLAREAIATNPNRYRSLEAREHAKKARAMLGAGPQRTCSGCGKVFQQRTPIGLAIYCSKECRNTTYAEQRMATSKRRCRQPNGTFK